MTGNAGFSLSAVCKKIILRTEAVGKLMEIVCYGVAIS